MSRPPEEAAATRATASTRASPRRAAGEEQRSRTHWGRGLWQSPREAARPGGRPGAGPPGARPLVHRPPGMGWGSGDLTDWTSSSRSWSENGSPTDLAHTEATACCLLRTGAGRVCAEGWPARQGAATALAHLPWVRATPEVSPLGLCPTNLLPAVTSTGPCTRQESTEPPRGPPSGSTESRRTPTRDCEGTGKAECCPCCGPTEQSGKKHLHSHRILRTPSRVESKPAATSTHEPGIQSRTPTG